MQSLGTPTPPGEVDSDAPWEALTAAELAFFFAWRGVDAPSDASLEQAKAHIAAVWRTHVARLFRYRCVARLSFLTPRVHLHPSYATLLSRCAGAATCRVADVGCGLGQETRRLVVDGALPANVVAIDLNGGYWKAGLALFGDSPSHGSLAAVTTAFGDWAAPVAPLELAFSSAFDAVVCYFVLHVLSKIQQLELLARLRRCAKPGALCIGACVGCEGEAGSWGATPDEGNGLRWLHSRDSLMAQLLAAGWSEAGMEVTSRPRKEGECGGGGVSYPLREEQGAMASLIFTVYA